MSSNSIEIFLTSRFKKDLSQVGFSNSADFLLKHGVRGRIQSVARLMRLQVCFSK